MTPAVERPARSPRGAALLSAVVVLVLIGVVAIIVLRATRRGLHGSVAKARAREVHYLAESGLEMARGLLRPDSRDAGPGGPAQALAAAAGPNGRIDFSPDTLRVVEDGTGRPIALAGFGDDVPLQPFTKLADGGYAAFVANDDAEGAATSIDGNGRIRVVGVGAGRDRAVETVEAEAPER